MFSVGAKKGCENNMVWELVYWEISTKTFKQQLHYLFVKKKQHIHNLLNYDIIRTAVTHLYIEQ